MADEKEKPPVSKKELAPYKRARCRRCGMASVATLFVDGECSNRIACTRRIDLAVLRKNREAQQERDRT